MRERNALLGPFPVGAGMAAANPAAVNHPFDLFRYTPIATSLSRLDDGHVVHVNDAYLDLFDVTEEQIVGRTPGASGILFGEPAQRDRGFGRLRAGAAIDRMALEVETANGRHSMELTSRVVDIEGVPHALSTFVDLTDRRREESAAKRTAEWMRELAESVHEAFWISDPLNTEMLYVSPAYERIFGRTCAQLYADPSDWMNALHPDDRARMDAFRTTPIAAEQRDHFRVVAKDGTLRTIQIKVFPVRDASAAVIRVAGVAEDITDRLQLEDQLRETQKLESLGLLAGGVAHDFNNILAVIAANGSMLAEVVPEGHPDRELLDEIDHAVRRATGLTRQLLAFSRKQVIEPVVLELNAAVNDTRKMLRRMVGEDVVIRTSLEPELGRVRIDPGYLVQVLMNLAVNARDAMPRGGTLTITTRNVDATREVMVSVSDTGCGMPPEVKARVFEPLFTTKGVGKGTGLGLSVVRGIIDQAGGRIEIDTQVDAGTELRIYLPIEDAPADPIANIAGAGSHGNEKLLVVDDDPHVRQSIARALRGRGYDVHEASDGQAALKLLRDHGSEIALLVTDVVMPVMDGRELVETARRRRPSLPVLYMSGYIDDAVLLHGVERAQIAVLEKPFRGYELAERVRQVIDANSDGGTPGSQELRLGIAASSIRA